VGLAEGYTFVVDGESLKEQFDNAGLYAAVWDGDLDNPQLRRKFVVVVMGEGGEALAEKLRGRGCVVGVYPPSLFHGLVGKAFRSRGESVLRRVEAGVYQ